MSFFLFVPITIFKVIEIFVLIGNKFDIRDQDLAVFASAYKALFGIRKIQKPDESENNIEIIEPSDKPRESENYIATNI